MARQRVVIGDRADRDGAPVADGQLLDELCGASVKREDDAGKHELHDEQERHDGHRRGRGAHDAGHHQRDEVSGIGDDPERQREVDQEVSCDNAADREADAVPDIDADGNQNLQEADQRLVQHVCHDIRTDMESRAVLPLDDRTLPADDLDGIEEAVPDADADEGEGTRLQALHIGEQALPDDEGHHERDDG